MTTTGSIEIGDIVQLKSGGPKMTVRQIDEMENSLRVANCMWFSLDEEIKYERFSMIVLKVVT